MCLYLVLELGLSRSYCSNMGAIDGLSLLLITKRLEIIQIIAKNVRKEMRSALGCFWRIFHF